LKTNKPFSSNHNKYLDKLEKKIEQLTQILAKNK